ncbi:MAG: MarR family winged helix-turn-helix transcriptional regulator [Pleomorphochaeta sp.]
MVKQELKAFIAMSRALNEINRNTISIVKEYGISTSQFAVLEALYHKGDLTVGEVQEKILSTSGTIAVVIRNLENSGLIYKTQDSNDKRRYILKLSDKGLDLIAKVYPKNEKMLLSVMSSLNQEELNNLLLYMKRLTGYSHT